MNRNSTLGGFNSNRSISFGFGSRGFASTSANKKKIALIPGDGVGKEIVPVAKDLLDALKLPFDYVNLDAGWETFQKTGKALPAATVEALKECQGAIFGAVSSPSTRVEGYSSPIIGMRNALDLYANLRPSNSAPIESSRKGIDMLIVRENTECLYVKKERYEDNGNRVVAERWITSRASTRIAKMAFEQALARQAAGNNTRKPMVTIVHKSNVLSLSDGMFRESCLKVAQDYPSVQVEEQLVDSMVYKMILDPTKYDVVVAPNLYGDILSDAAAALVGGLGLAPSANVGDNFTLVEPVHGSAPDIAGKGIVNPIATIKATALLLERLGFNKEAQAVHKAVYDTLKDGPKTPDLKGKATTADVSKYVIEKALGK